MYFTVDIVAVQHLTVELCEVDAISMEKVSKLQTGVKSKRFHHVFFCTPTLFPQVSPLAPALALVTGYTGSIPDKHQNWSSTLAYKIY